MAASEKDIESRFKVKKGKKDEENFIKTGEKGLKNAPF